MKLPSVYEPQQYEADIYALWERKGAFQPEDRGGKGYFSLVLPPPNANGDLHIGHALTVAIEDALARYHRQQGRATLYVPGADHAGFETWVVYEKKLNQEGKSRFDYSREELYQQVWDFVQMNKHNFEAQLRSLGTSVDWSRYSFTLDPKVVNTAYDTFQKMWHDKLIYRGSRIVNFCTFHGTSFSDIEVVHEEEKSKLWHISYPLTDDSGEVMVATTRPETMLGDTAVAVHPGDKRYKQLIGKTVRLPLVDKEITIVGDEMVDPKFGSGAVKVTPAHDPNDFEVAQRHKLPMVEVISAEGKMTDAVPEQFRGMTVAEARRAVVKELQGRGYLKSVEDFTHSVGKCYKCGTTIEPLLREQWFVRMQPLAEKAIEKLNDKQISFYPPSKLGQTVRYLEEVKDWNISRQIPWGIPIPAFQNTKDPSDWIFDTHIHEEEIEVKGKKYRRDPDVFDTWFSSGQWPYVTLDYPDGEDFKHFYPLSLMETGGEILYQWVARMIMLGLYRTDEVPFKNVYIHGYVLAEDGQKMSKSLGNVVNPLEAVAEFGSDALRMGLLTGRRAGINQGYHSSKIKAARNFSNKLWNVARFIEDKVGDEHHKRQEAKPESRADHWILSRLAKTTKEMSKALESYRLSEAYEELYHFIWHDVADWYVEVSKSSLNPGMLAFILESSLKLSHPFAPFVTETIWQTLSWEKDSILAVEKWNQVSGFDRKAAGEFQQLIGVINEVRQISAALAVNRPKLYLKDAPLLMQESTLIALLGRLGGVLEASEGPGQGLKLTDSEYIAWLDIDSQTASKYLSSLREKHLAKQETIRRLEARLKNPSYNSKAPKELVEESKKHLEEEKQLLSKLEDELNRFQAAAEKLV